MRIELTNVGKRYGLNWIIKGFNFSFKSGNKYAITGPNGSGKSTLLKLISGGLEIDTGKINYKDGNGKVISNNALNIGYCAPYVNLIRELTLEEMIEFHYSFKNHIDECSKDELLDILSLKDQRKKLIKNFSSGIQQCIKLSLLFATDYKILLLDEPTTNLDVDRKKWYLSMVQRFSLGRTIIVASNDEFEYSFVDEELKVGDSNLANQL